MFIIYAILLIAIIGLMAFGGGKIYKTFFTNAKIQFIEEE